MTRIVIQAAWTDVPHLSTQAKADLEKSYPPHERAARMAGTPQLGAGAIYPIPETEIIVQPFQFPVYWRQAYALDVGWNRTAALWGAHDPETDVLYIYSEYYRAQAEPAIHAQAIRARGEWIPGVIDPASRGRTQDDGQQLYNMYVQLGLNLSFAKNAVEAGLYEVWTRLSTGRIKVFSTLQNFLMEYRLYRRDDKGRVLKENDHLCDCLRYLVMSGINVAQIRPPEGWGRDFKGSKPQHGITYDPFAEGWNSVPKTDGEDYPRYRH